MMLVSSDVANDLAAGDTGKERNCQNDSPVFRASQETLVLLQWAHGTLPLLFLFLT